MKHSLLLPFAPIAGVPIPVNLLTAAQSDMEGSIAGWGNNVNASLSDSTAQAAHGTHSLALTAMATATFGGTPNQVSALTGSIVGVLPSTEYTVLASVYPTVTGLQAAIRAAFYDASNNNIGNIQTANIPVNQGVWTQLSFSGVSPANTTHAIVFVYFDAASGNPINAGVANYVDMVSLAAGTSTTWTVGQ